MTSKATTSPRDRARTPPTEGEQRLAPPAPSSTRRGSTSTSTSATIRGSTSTRPLAELTGFKTRKGVVLLYEPDPLDMWIGKKIQKEAGGTLTDTETGATLTKQ